MLSKQQTMSISNLNPLHHIQFQLPMHSLNLHLAAQPILIVTFLKYVSLAQLQPNTLITPTFACSTVPLPTLPPTSMPIQL